MDGVRSESGEANSRVCLIFCITQEGAGQSAPPKNRVFVTEIWTKVEFWNPAFFSQELLCGFGGCVQEGHGNLHGTAVSQSWEPRKATKTESVWVIGLVFLGKQMSGDINRPCGCCAALLPPQTSSLTSICDAMR